MVIPRWLGLKFRPAHPLPPRSLALITVSHLHHPSALLKRRHLPMTKAGFHLGTAMATCSTATQIDRNMPPEHPILPRKAPQDTWNYSQPGGKHILELISS
ncbi:uncharacterized protein BDV17DRAFT_273044 [Aspergillus undulatus]|uniref:uncharacterized protein n=1 Tax=Aspergillus undulatus TaxID=1810928 RepID=UPI003CCCE8AF